jgi:nicotinamide-nucleotide amidase
MARTNPAPTSLEIEMLAVGRELLIGKTVDTNAHWIGGRLARLGTRLSRIATIDDNLDEISSAVRESLTRRPGYLLTVGGLGPTPDDMTLQGLAKGLRKKLALNKEALEMMRQHYREIGRSDVEMTPERLKMATIPTGSRPLPNKVGTAAGVRLVVGSVVIFSLPGVPREMKEIFKGSVEGEIKDKLGEMHSRTVVMRLEGIYESTLAPMIKQELKSHPRAYIKSHPKGSAEGVSKVELDIVFTSRDSSETEEASEIAERLSEKVRRAGGTIRDTKVYAR